MPHLAERGRGARAAAGRNGGHRRHSFDLPGLLVSAELVQDQARDFARFVLDKGHLGLDALVIKLRLRIRTSLISMPTASAMHATTTPTTTALRTPATFVCSRRGAPRWIKPGDRSATSTATAIRTWTTTTCSTRGWRARRNTSTTSGGSSGDLRGGGSR